MKGFSFGTTVNMHAKTQSKWCVAQTSGDPNYRRVELAEVLARDQCLDEDDTSRLGAAGESICGREAHFKVAFDGDGAKCQRVDVS